MASSANRSPPKASPTKVNNVHNVLKILSSRLDTKGDIRDTKDAVYITDLMREAVKLVDRCMFLNVLLATKNTAVLSSVLDTGGWGTLHSWLLECKAQETTSIFLVELLKLYKQLPVTVELLRQNSCAKDIKQLAKSPDEYIAAAAKTIVAHWMERVKKASSSDGLTRHSDKSSGHRSKSSSASSSLTGKNRITSARGSLDDDTEPSRVRTLHDSPDHITAKMNQHSLSADIRSAAAAASDESNSSTSMDTSESAAVVAENRRPKTVKMIGNKMRSTGNDDVMAGG